jgi:hypothetical protein
MYQQGFYQKKNWGKVHDKIKHESISNTYVPFPQLFAKAKSLKSEGIGMPRDKNKGLHGACRTNKAVLLLRKQTFC